MGSQEGGIETYSITQAIADVSMNIRRNRDKTIVFRQEDANDKKAVMAMIGSEHRSTLYTLTNHQYIELYHGEVTVKRTGF